MIRTLCRSALLATALGLAGCGELSLFWVQAQEPIARTKADQLDVGRADLTRCLDQLGAPLRVWQTPKGLALSYGWLQRFFWKFDVTVRFSGIEGLDGRTLFSYNQINDGYEGFVLVFDDALRLQFVRHGRLADITRDLPQRPAFIEE